MIGWYHSGPKLRASDLTINELFKRYIPRPIMVIVDVRPEAVGIPTDAYFAVEEIKDVSPFKLRSLVSLPIIGRMAQRHVKHFCMSLPLLRQKKLKRLVLNTSYGISSIQQQRHYQPE